MKPAFGLSLLCVAALAACLPSEPPKQPLPPATGQPEPFSAYDNENFQAVRTLVDGAPNGQIMRIYRLSPPGFTYADGAAAKAAAQSFCMIYGAELDPASMGMFEPVGAWVFPGGCV